MASNEWYPVGGNGGIASDVMTSEVIGKRRIKVSGDSLTSAFGELLIAESEPVTQISSEYGMLSVLTAEFGGTTDIVDNMFSASTDAVATGVAAIVSERESNQRPGQGLSVIFSALFTQGVQDSTQQAGAISSSAALAFGYDGSSFGVMSSNDGDLEVQELTITIGAGGVGETATVKVDGTDHLISITNSSINQNAFEIATYLNANELRYRFTSNLDTVVAVGRLPDLGAGAFSFSSTGSASASWVEIQNGTIPTETWVPKEQWNVTPNIDIDPTKLNDYKVQMQGNVKFFVKRESDSAFILVHEMQFINSTTQPNINNPTFRIGWAVRNTGNTSVLSVRGGYGASFVEGQIKYNQLPLGDSNIQSSVGLSLTNIIGFRNRLVFNDIANRAEIIPLILSLGTDSTKPTIFEVIANPVTSDYLEWEYIDKNDCLMEVCKNDALITGGRTVAVFLVGANGLLVDMSSIVSFHVPFAEFSIAARVTQGASSDMIASGTWKEDL